MVIEDLQRRVQRSNYFIVGAITIALAVYMLKLWLISDLGISDDPSSWAEFGDYIGGIVNPLIAYLAFYWLTQSVLLQKEELADTRQALQDSAGAQLKQERHAARTAQINALNSLLTSHNSDLASLRDGAEFMTGQLRNASSNNIAYLPNGHQTNYQGAIDEIASTGERIAAAAAARDEVIAQIKALLSEQNG